MKKLGLALLLLSSCTMHPHYDRPVMAMPTTWRIEEMQGYMSACFWQELNEPILDTLINESLANNQDLKVAVARINEFSAKLGIVRSELYPQLSLAPNAERSKNSTNVQPITPGIQDISNTYGLVLNASYEVDIWGKIRSATQASYAELMSQEEIKKTIVLTLVSSVANTYIELRQFDAQLFISQETLDTRNQSYNLAKIRYSLGLTSEMEVEQALSEVQDAESSVLQFQKLIALTEDLLSFLIGKPPFTIPRGKRIDELLLPLSIPTYLPAEIVAQRPDILAVEQQLIAANARIGVAKALFFPQISLFGSYGAESSELNNFFTNPSKVWSYGATLLQEIFTGGRLTSNLKLTKAVKMEMLHSYESTILQGLQEANDALISFQIASSLVKVEKEKVRSLTAYYNLSKLRYEDGLTDYLTFLDAERQLFTAEIGYAASLGENLNSFVNIYKSLGGGWVNTANQISENTLNLNDIP